MPPRNGRGCWHPGDSSEQSGFRCGAWLAATFEQCPSDYRHEVRNNPLEPRSGFCAPAVVGSKRTPRRPRRPATKAASRYKTSTLRDGVRSLLVIGCRGLKNAIHCTAFTLPVLRSRGRRAIGLPVDPQGRGAACLLRPGFAPDHASPAGRVESPRRAESAGTVRRSTRRREQSTGRETENHLPRLLNQRFRRSAQPA